MNRDLLCKIVRERTDDYHGVLKELAQITGLNINSISARLTGKRKWTSNEIELIRIAYSLTPEEVIDIFIKEKDDNEVQRKIP